MLPRWLRAIHPRRLGELSRAALRFETPAPLLAAYLRPATVRFPVTIRMRNGTVLTLRHGHDAATAWVVFCREEYEVPVAASFIVDIGANWGAFSIFAARKAPAAQIVAIEPHPDEFPHLRVHLAENRLGGRITPLQVAIARESGARWMDADPAHPGPSRGMHPPSVRPPPASVSVTAMSLRGALDRARTVAGISRIDLVKMDIEGGEHEILPDLHPHALADVDAWVMEYHPNGPKGPLFDALERAGLHLVRDDEANRDSGVAHFSRSPLRRR